jgi:hypothetical protein
MTQRRPFFPDNKPRSWVIGVSAALLGLGFGALAFLGYALNVGFLARLGSVLFVVCWAVGFSMVVLFNVKLFSGQYRDLGPSPWSARPW